MTAMPTDAGRVLLSRPIAPLRRQKPVMIGMILLGVTLAGAIALTSIAIFNRASARHMESLATLDKLKAVERDLVNARILEQQFTLRRQSEMADGFERQIEEVALDLADLRRHAADGPSRQKLAELDRLLAIYRDDVTKVQALWLEIELNANEALIKNMRANRIALEMHLKKQAAAEIAILLVAKHEKDFIARASADEIGMNRDAVAQTRTAILQAIRNPAIRDQYLGMLSDYEVSFSRFAQARLAIAAAEGRIQPVFASIQGLLRDLVQNAQADFGAGVVRQAKMTRVNLWLVGFGAFVMILVLGVIVFVLGHTDSAPAEPGTRPG